jgi:hypothetical protein
MPLEAPLRLIKACHLFRSWSGPASIPKGTRGLYVLYVDDSTSDKPRFLVKYIGVAGLGTRARGGIGFRLRRHARRKPGWTHYSLF